MAPERLVGRREALPERGVVRRAANCGLVRGGRRGAVARLELQAREARARPERAQRLARERLLADGARERGVAALLRLWLWLLLLLILPLLLLLLLRLILLLLLLAAGRRRLVPLAALVLAEQQRAQRLARAAEARVERERARVALARARRVARDGAVPVAEPLKRGRLPRRAVGRGAGRREELRVRVVAVAAQVAAELPVDPVF